MRERPQRHARSHLQLQVHGAQLRLAAGVGYTGMGSASTTGFQLTWYESASRTTQRRGRSRRAPAAGLTDELLDTPRYRALGIDLQGDEIGSPTCANGALGAVGTELPGHRRGD